MEVIVQSLLQEKVKWMAGEVSGDFHEHVTHLIVGEVSSKKYRYAGRYGKHLLAPTFIDALWTANRRQFVQIVLNRRCVKHSA